MCCCSFSILCILICRCFLSLFDFQATLPCHRHSILASQTREDLHQLWALPWLLLIAFSFSSTASATVLSGHLLPTGVFYLTLLPNIFGTFLTFWHIPDILAQPAFIKVSLGAGSYFFESCRASYWSPKHRPGLSVCLIHSNPQSFIHLSFVFMHINIAEVLLMVKTYGEAKLISTQTISIYLNCSLKKCIT